MGRFPAHSLWWGLQTLQYKPPGLGGELGLTGDGWGGRMVTGVLQAANRARQEVDNTLGKRYGGRATTAWLSLPGQGTSPLVTGVGLSRKPGESRTGFHLGDRGGTTEVLILGF